VANNHDFELRGTYNYKSLHGTHDDTIGVGNNTMKSIMFTLYVKGQIH